MKLEIGKQYGTYTYDGFIDSQSNYTCDVCGQDRQKHHWFHKTDSDPSECANIKIGSECIKKDNFWTKLLGLVK